MQYVLGFSASLYSYFDIFRVILFLYALDMFACLDDDDDDDGDPFKVRTTIDIHVWNPGSCPSFGRIPVAR